MLNKIKQILTKLYNNIQIVILGIVFIIMGYYINLSNKLKLEVEIKTNNIEAFQGIINNEFAANNVLRLDMSTLRASNDKLLHNIDSVRKELKISNKNLKLALSQHSDIIVSGKDTVLMDSLRNFSKEFKPNKLTLIKIVLLDDSVSYSLKISNDQYLLVHKDRDWKNKDKKFLKRLITFDWKKIDYYEYNIINTNELIKIGLTRVIENTESK